MKNRATNSKDSTRSIFASVIETVSNPAISALPKIDSVLSVVKNHLQLRMQVILHLPVKLYLLRNTNLLKKQAERASFLIYSV